MSDLEHDSLLVPPPSFMAAMHHPGILKGIYYAALAMVLLIAALYSLPSASQDTPDVVGLYPDSGFNASLIPYAAYKYIDADTSISDAVIAGDFQRSTQGPLTFGRAIGTMLFVFDVENRGDEVGRWVFSTGRVVVLAAEFCEFKDTELLSCFDSIGNPNHSKHLQEYHAHSLVFSLQPGERRRIALRFHGSNISILFPTIRTESGHQAAIWRNLQITTVATVATLVLVILNACLFFMIRNTAFGYFVLAELAFLYQSLHLVNYPTIYFFSENIGLGGVFSSLAHISFGVFSVRFAQVFLRTKASAPLLHNFLSGFLWLAACVLFVVLSQYLLPSITSRNAVFLSALVSTLASLILPFVGVWSAIRYGRYYLPLMFSWLILGGFCFYYTLAAMGVLEGIYEIRHWFGIIGFVEAFFITLTIGLELRLMQNREIQAQASLQEELVEKVQLLEESNELAQKKNVALTDLADRAQLILSAGHDARNFLFALHAVSECIQLAEEPEQVRRFGLQVAETADLLNNTLSTIIYSSSSVSSHSNLLTLEMVDVAALMKTLMLVHEQSAKQKGLGLSYRTSLSSFPGDATLITRIVSNLVSNAIKYSHRGRVLICARRRGGNVVFQVFDQGEGVDPQALSFLVDVKSERVRLQKEVEGEGVGLEISQVLAARLGGSIQARSSPGVGSCFELTMAAENAVAQPMTLMFSTGLAIPDTNSWPDENFVSLSTEDLPTLQPVDVIFLYPSTFRVLDAESLVPENASVVMVSDDRSIDFREEWSGKADMIVFAPLTPPLLRLAMTLLATKSSLAELSGDQGAP